MSRSNDAPKLSIYTYIDTILKCTRYSMQMNINYFNLPCSTNYSKYGMILTLS